jgi:hypothetical protein
MVYVDPDEREMIIEKEGDSVGRGLRRCAVQRLMDSGGTCNLFIGSRQGTSVMGETLHMPSTLTF